MLFYFIIFKVFSSTCPAAVWDMESQGLFSEDASARNGKSVYQVLTRVFDAAYEGNRAPVPLFVHGAWLQDNVEDVVRFVGERCVGAASSAVAGRPAGAAWQEQAVLTCAGMVWVGSTAGQEEPTVQSAGPAWHWTHRAV